MPGIATPLGEDIGGYAGVANLYRVDPPILDPSGQGPAGGYGHVVVWVQGFVTPGAKVIPARVDGSAIVMNEMPGSYVHPEATHAGALFLAGYEVGPPDPPEPEPPVDPPTDPEPEPDPPVDPPVEPEPEVP